MAAIRPTDRSVEPQPGFKYPGIRAAMDGNAAVISCERESSDAAGAYPITPSTQMGEHWAEHAANGHVNISGRPLVFIEPEGEHAAAAVTAGLSMTGLRAANFSSGQGIAYMHESLYAAVGKRLTYVLNIGTRAMTKATLNVHAGHDDYHCIDDTGFFQLFAKNVQHAADLNIIAHRIAELALNPGIVAQDGFLTTHLIESVLLPERALIAEYLGKPEDLIPTPTPAQRILYGESRRRIPELWDVDNPVMAGIVQNQDAYMQSVAAQRPFFFEHIEPLADQAFADFHELTGRRYARILSYLAEDADYLILGQGSLIPNAEAAADYLRASRKIKVGVIDLVMFRPFPRDLLSRMLKGKKGVAVLERLDQPLAADPPLMREIRATVSQCIENGRTPKRPPHPSLAVYRNLEDVPPLYSGSFGLGSRDLQPEGLVAAIENMLPDGKHHGRYYLGIEFLHPRPRTPKQEIYQQTLEQAYPQLRDLALHGSENPNLMPEGSIAVRMHSIGGWGAITTGKNLAMTLFELLAYHVKANPKYGSEKKGQPTTYFLSAAPEPIRINCEYNRVDIVLSPDPNVFHHTNALAGLTEGGVFIIQSEQPSPDRVWTSIPAHYRKTIVERKIRFFYLDAFKIAREEASDPDLQLRMQGIAFQGAFFAASPVMERAGLGEEALVNAIRQQLQRKFGGKGARVVEDNLRVVQRGFDEVRSIQVHPDDGSDAGSTGIAHEPPMPTAVAKLPQSRARIGDIHRFWEQTGNFYARGQGGDNLSDPFIALGVMPAASALFRDLSGIRFQHPRWIAENCTACGKCYTVCPDTAIPGLVSELSEVLDSILRRVVKRGHRVKHLSKAVRAMETPLRALCQQAGDEEPVRALMEEAVRATLAESIDTQEKSELEREFRLFWEALGDFEFALSKPYFTLPEKTAPGSGGLFSITVNPYTCKGCSECIAVCDDDALRPVRQSEDSLKRLRSNWDFWQDLPNTPKKFIRVDNLEEGIGALETILLDKRTYRSFTSGDGACMGCSEKTVLHLFIATVESLMRPRIEKHVTDLDDLIQRMERHIQRRMVEEIDLDDTKAMAKVVGQIGESDLTLSRIADQIEKLRGTHPIDPDWFRRVTRLLSALKTLRWKYAEGSSGTGRRPMGMINATGCTSVWGSTYPYNPYPFPWANHLFQDSPSMAMGVFEGHMGKMAEGFKTIRHAELELAGRYDPTEHEHFFTRFNWRDFSEEEFALCPPVVVVGGDGAMYDIGFQNLSRALMSGKPIKVVVVDTQVYSNTGGQACTSGFLGQVSDMAPFGGSIAGKQEVRKEIGLIAMAHRTTYVMQGTIAHPGHLIEGFIEGLRAGRPAVFNCYTSCQPEHGIADDAGYRQAKLAVESRAYPLFRYNPDRGKTAEECFDLQGNPGIDRDWPVYRLDYVEGGRKKSLELPMTFADFATSEVRFRKHFRKVQPESWHEDMIPLADYLNLSQDAREGKWPYVWAIDQKKGLSRLLVDETMVASCEDRRNFWIMLKALAGIGKEPPHEQEIETRIRNELVGRLSAGLTQLLGAQGQTPIVPALPAEPVTGEPPGAGGSDRGYLAPWIDSEACSSCGECVKLDPNLFTYDENRKAKIKNPSGGPYSNLVKAAEKCPTRVIHPGLPRDRSVRDIEKWIERAGKYN